MRNTRDAHKLNAIAHVGKLFLFKLTVRGRDFFNRKVTVAFDGFFRKINITNY